MMMEKATILIVDDTQENIDILSSILRSHYKIKTALNGKIALKIARSNPKPDLILLDIMMPEIDGYEVCKQLKQDLETKKIPIIFVTAKSEIEDEKIGFSLGASDYITKPIKPSLVLVRVKTHLDLYNQSRHLEELVKARTIELTNTHFEIIKQLGRAAEYKDNETGLHMVRMSKYTKLLAEKVSNDEDWIELLYNAAPMHDIGKIGIPDRVLLKPDRLDAAEWNIMKKHTNYGVEIIGNNFSPLLQLAKEVALYHHEKWNGEGYPNGVSGEDIPLPARIVAIADVFDALTSARPYKQAWSVERAIALLEEEAGKHFDPNLVPLFVECLPEIIKIKEHYADSTN